MGACSSSAKNWGWMVTIPAQGPTPNVKLAARGYEIDLHCRFICALSRSARQWESCIVLQSRLTRSLVAKFLQRSVVTCSTQIKCCMERILQMRSRTGVCEPLMPDVVANKVHQNNCSYVSSADLPSDSLCKNLAWWAVTWRTTKLSKWEVGGACPGQHHKKYI